VAVAQSTHRPRRGGIRVNQPERNETMKTEIKDGNLIITIPINPKPFQPSKSGKSLNVASSNGILTTSTLIDGKPLKVGLNCFIGQ
jgi:hypothetical protein